MNIDIYEPYPSRVAVERCRYFPSVNFVTSIDGKYDCLLSIDVLEHVPDPLFVLAEMTNVVHMNGFLIIANCFYPVTKCHLPRTFHFRYTFSVFARLMGLRSLGPVRGSHATVYQKISDKPFNWRMVRTIERLSIAFSPALRIIYFCYRGGRKLGRVVK